MLVSKAMKMFGLSEGDGLPELKRSYRAMVSVFHPDRGGEHQVMVRVNEAYALLRECPMPLTIPYWEKTAPPPPPPPPASSVVCEGRWNKHRDTGVWQVIVALPDHLGYVGPEEELRVNVVSRSGRVQSVWCWSTSNEFEGRFGDFMGRRCVFADPEVSVR